MLVRGLSTIAAVAAATVVLTATGASAHFCDFNDPNPNGDAGRAGSNGFVSFGAIAAASEGICPAGAEVLADAVGVTTSTLINADGVMAGPTDGNKAISHLDFAALEVASRPRRPPARSTRGGDGRRPGPGPQKGSAPSPAFAPVAAERNAQNRRRGGWWR